MLSADAQCSLAFLASRRGRLTTAADVIAALPAAASEALAELVAAGLVTTTMTDSLDLGHMFSYAVAVDEGELAFALLRETPPGRRQRLSPLAAPPRPADH